MTSQQPAPQKMNNSDDVGFFISPAVSNMIFIGGAALCLFGLVLMVAAAILIHKSRSIKRKYTELTRAASVLAREQPSHVETEPTDVDNAMELHREVTSTAAQGRSHQNISTIQDHMPMASHSDEGHRAPSVDVAEYTDARQPGRSHGYENQAPPGPCSPPSAKPYACNPIPSPEVTQHYDQAIPQYAGYDVDNWCQDQRGQVMIPPPPKSSPPNPSPIKSTDYQYTPQAQSTFCSAPMGTYPDPHNDVEYPYQHGSPANLYQHGSPAIPQRAYTHNRNDSFSSATQGMASHTQPSYPVSTEGSIRGTYM